MRRPTTVPRKIELHWQQWGPEEWRALLVDRQSGRAYEVSAPMDLWTALNQVMLDPVVSTAKEQSSDPGQHERAAEPRSDPRRDTA